MITKLAKERASSCITLDIGMSVVSLPSIAFGVPRYNSLLTLRSDCNPTLNEFFGYLYRRR